MDNTFLQWLHTHMWWFIGTAIVLLVLMALFIIFFTGAMIFINTLYKKNAKPRVREFSLQNDPNPPPHALDQKQMFDQGIEWIDKHKDKVVDLHIVNDGLDLYAQYVDFGFDKCAIVLQGRTESLLYSYYFADVYAKNGYNILSIDVRAHGLSDGQFITAGIKESEDLIEWIRLVKDKFSMDNFLIHGICIGAATAIYAYETLKKQNSKDLDLIKKVVLDGTFVSYKEIFSNHIKERKKPRFVFLHLVFWYLWICTRVNLFKKTPLQSVEELDIPTLFIYSKQDTYAVPEKAELMFKACGSKNKQLKFFPKGRHSHVRFNNTEEYDKAIEEFINRE